MFGPIGFMTKQQCLPLGLSMMNEVDKRRTEFESGPAEAAARCCWMDNSLDTSTLAAWIFRET